MLTYIEDGHLGGCARADADHPHGDPDSYLPRLWDFLLGHFHARTVLDLGCGQGHAVEYFVDAGRRVIGIEGSQAVINEATIRARPRILRHDFTVGPLIAGWSKPHLVWCCEFVEHVEERFVANYLPHMCSASRVLAMTHGLPGQEGYHHVTLKSPDFWISLVESHSDLRFSPEVTAQSKTICNRGYWANSGLIFVPKKA